VEETADLRYVVSGPGGYLRVLVGMVRANRPWRLAPGLSKTLAAALATGAVATMNSTVWSLAASLSTPRLVIAMVGSVATMIGWLIVDAELWHRSAKSSPEARQRARVYNASTVVTVGIGVLVCYVGLMVINWVWALFILNDQVFASVTRNPLRAEEYLTLSWFVASLATVGGALGSGVTRSKTTTVTSPRSEPTPAQLAPGRVCGIAAHRWPAYRESWSPAAVIRTNPRPLNQGCSPQPVGDAHQAEQGQRQHTVCPLRLRRCNWADLQREPRRSHSIPAGVCAARRRELTSDVPESDRCAGGSAVDGRPTVFWRPGCKYWLRLRIRLGRSPRQLRWVDIWRDPTGAAAVRQPTTATRPCRPSSSRASRTPTPIPHGCAKQLSFS
jgi:hypothetical protein